MSERLNESEFKEHAKSFVPHYMPFREEIINDAWSIYANNPKFDTLQCCDCARLLTREAINRLTA